MRSIALARLGAGLGLILGVTLATASAAFATTTLTVNAGPRVEIAAAAGVANNMVITLNGASLTVTDPADTITAPAPCTGSGTNTVTCPFASSVQRLDADVKDLNDSLRADTSSFVTLSGGNGSDEVIATTLPGAVDARTNIDGDDPDGDPAGDGDDRLVGGEMSDFIEGGGGRDTLIGGGGDDTLQPEAGDGDIADGGPGDDGISWQLGDGTGETLEGGPGYDTLTASGTNFTPPFTAALLVDLAAGVVQQTAGGAASATATGFEDAEGFGASATLRGTDGPNRLLTGDADDSVTAGSGSDFVDVNGGADQVFVRDGFADRVRCGTGADTVEADQFDELYDCETIARLTVLPAGVDRVGPVCKVRGPAARMSRKRFLRRLRPSVACNEPATLEARLTVRVRPRRGRLQAARAGDLVLVDRKLPLAAGSRKVTLKVPRALRSALPRRRFSARLIVIARDSFGNTRRASRTVRVR